MGLFSKLTDEQKAELKEFEANQRLEAKASAAEARAERLAAERQAEYDARKDAIIARAAQASKPLSDKIGDAISRLPTPRETIRVAGSAAINATKAAGKGTISAFEGIKSGFQNFRESRSQNQSQTFNERLARIDENATIFDAYGRSLVGNRIDSPINYESFEKYRAPTSQRKTRFKSRTKINTGIPIINFSEPFIPGFSEPARLAIPKRTTIIAKKVIVSPNNRLRIKRLKRRK